MYYHEIYYDSMSNYMPTIIYCVVLYRAFYPTIYNINYPRAKSKAVLFREKKKSKPALKLTSRISIDIDSTCCPRSSTKKKRKKNTN